MEGPHRQLRARFADGLGGDDAHRRADLHLAARRKVAAVALRAHAVFGVAGEARTDPDLLDARLGDGGAGRLVDDLVRLHEHVAVRVGDVVERRAAEDALRERDLDLVALDDRLHLDAVDRVAVLHRDDDVLRNVHELTREVAGVGRLQSGIGQTLAGAVGRNEVLENRKPFAEGSRDRAFDDVAGRVGHEAAHTGELTDLELRATSLGIDHHEHRVQLGRFRVLRRHVAVDRLVQILAHLLRGGGPDIDHLVVAFAVGDHALLELSLNLVGVLTGLGDHLVLVRRTDHVLETHGRAGDRHVVVAEVLEVVDQLHGGVMPGHAVAVEDEVADGGLRHLVVPEAHLLGEDRVEDHAARRRLDRALLLVAVRTLRMPEVGVAETDAAVVGDATLRDAELDLTDVVEERQVLAREARLARHLAGELVLLAGRGEEVETQAHILRRRHHGLAGGRAEDRGRRQHHQARFHLRLDGERHVHGHLVAVEVGVERRADHRVEADRLAFHQHRLERLDRKAVERRGAVEEHGLVLDHLVQHVPHLGRLALDHLARRTHRVADALVLERTDDERLEETERHLLRETTLRQLELGADHDHGTAGVVHALAEEVLAEAARLALQDLGEGLERTVAGAGHRASVASVVEHRVHRLLEHALLVADDHVRRLEREQVLETVVAVDHAAVEVIQVGGREAAALERDERTQLRRNYRQHVQNHPLGLAVRAAEAIDDLHALGDLLAVLLGAGVLHLLLELEHELVEVELVQHLADRLRAHLGLEPVAVLGLRVHLLLVGHRLPFLERRVARLHDHPVLVVQHALKRRGRHV